MPHDSRKSILTYLLFVVLFSSVFYSLIIGAHDHTAGMGLYVGCLMWCPGMAAIVTLKLHRRSLADLGWRWPSRRFALMAWLIPLGYALTAYLIVWLTGLGGFPNHDFMDRLASRMGLHLSPAMATIMFVLLTGTYGMAGSLASSLGEEIGWRGFLVPELSKTFSYTATSLISGLVWTAWHVPALIGAGYNGGVSVGYGLACFAVLVVSCSFIFAWIRLASGSLWTGALLHASHNLYIQNILNPLTRDTGRTAWFTNEFGAVLPLVTVAIAIYFWSKRKELAVNADGQLLNKRSDAATA